MRNNNGIVSYKNEYYTFNGDDVMTLMKQSTEQQ